MSYPMLMPISGGTEVPPEKKRPLIAPPEPTGSSSSDAATFQKAAGSGGITPFTIPTRAPGSNPGVMPPETSDRITPATTPALTPHPKEAAIKAETARIEADTDLLRRQTDDVVADRKATEGRMEDVRNIDTTKDGFAYSPEDRAQLGKAGANFRFDLPEDLALKRKRLTDPGFIPPDQIPAESTPEEYQGTVDRLNKKYEGKATFRYDPVTNGVVGTGGPEQQARAAQEKADRLARARTDLAEARQKGISIGELRDQRAELARAQHQAEVAKTQGGTTQAGDPAGSAAPAFTERVERSQSKYNEAIASGDDMLYKTAARGAYRAHRDERVGPFAEKPSTQDRALFTNHVGQLMASKGVGSAKAKVLNEALDKMSMRDVQYLLKNPTLGNANELEELLFMDLFGNADGVSRDDIKGLGTLIMESYGVDYKGQRGTPKADDDE